jgi:hypothetical protein
MKLCTVCGVVTSRAGSRCTEHARLSGIGANHHVHADARWARLSKRMVARHVVELVLEQRLAEGHLDLPSSPAWVFCRSIVSVRLTQAAYANGLALALPQVVMARPEGVGREISTYTLPIEGRDEWIEAARRLA